MAQSRIDMRGKEFFLPKKEHIRIIWTPDDPEILPITINPEDLVVDPVFSAAALDYSHYFIFCSSTKDVSNAFKKHDQEYKYFVEFDKEDFNNKFEGFIKHHIALIDKNKKIEFRQPQIGEFNYLLFNRWDKYFHGSVKYYNITKPFNNEQLINVIMTKTLDFEHQYEYRHVIYLDYFKYDISKNRDDQFREYYSKYQGKNLQSKDEDLEFITRVNIILPLGQLKVISSGLL